MVQDLEPLTTPNTVLTDCLNGTLITYNGNEFVLQNDMGNCKVERAKLSPGFLPMGMKEHGGIIYIASYNPDTQECEVGSFPSPERDIVGTDSIENQTGLQDGYFDTSDYKTSILRSIPSGIFTPEEITSKIQKLNEQEVLQLSPGDMYITTYEVSPPTNPAPGAVVINNTNFGNYFSYDETNKKTFSINFYKIDSGNNIVKIPNNEIKTIAYRPDIESDEYIYYTQTSAGSIAVELELNTLNYFDSAVREFSKRSDSNKKIRIEAVGESDSDINFEGIRVDLVRNEDTSVERKSFHVEKIDPTNDKVSISVDEFVENDLVRCDITPYNQYGYMPKLMQSFNLEIGRNAFGGGVNDVFKWRVDDVNNRLELDFDFKYDTENDLKLYLEFYDTWSNISTIRSVPAPSVYGPMRLSITLEDEPRTTVFNTYPTPPTPPNLNNQKGGVSFSKLAVNNSNITFPSLINPAQSDGLLLIRNDNALRKDHFYIVRICGYEEDSSSGTIVRTFRDVYRGLYTSTIYNDIYQEQLSISPSNPAYTPNFNSIPYPLEKIGYKASILGKSDLNLSEKSAPMYNSGPVTTVNGITYPFSLNGSISPALNGVINAHTTYTYKKTYTVSLDRPDNYIYGNLANNTLQITNSAGDINYPSNVISGPSLLGTLNPNSSAALTVPNLNSGLSSYPLDLTIKTRRGAQGNIQEDSLAGSPTVKFLGEEWMYKPDFTGVINECANSANTTMSSRRTNINDARCNDNIPGSNPVIILKMRNGTVSGPSPTVRDSRDPDSMDVVNRISLFQDDAPDKQFFTVKHGTRTIHGVPVGSGTKSLYFVQRDPDRIISFSISTNTNNSTFNTIAKNFLNKLQVTILDPDSLPVTTYWVVASTILSYSDGSETKLTGALLDVTSEWDNPSSKTYVFNAILRGLGSSQTSFSTANVNSLINAAIGRTSNIEVESVPTLSDNKFIPFIDINTSIDPIISPLILDDETIRLGTDPELINAFENSKTVYDQELSKITGSSGDLSDITVKEGIFPTPELEDFMRIFKYSNLENQLVIVDEPGTSPIYAANGAVQNQDVRVRNVDFTTKIYNLT